MSLKKYLNSYFLVLAAIILLPITNLQAQNNSEDPVFKTEINNDQSSDLFPDKTKNILVDKALTIQISIINPNDRDAKNRKKTDVQYTTFSKALLNTQRHMDLEYWLKVSTRDGSPFQSGHLFSIKPDTLSKIDLYIPKLNNDKPIQTENRFSINTSPKYSRRALVFDIPETNNLSINNEVYFFIKSKKTADLSIKYWQADDYYRIDKKFNSFYAMIYAGLFIIVIVNFIFYIGIRDKNYILYILFLVSLLIILMTSSGKIYEFSFANYLASSENIINANKVLSIFLLVTFLQHFLKIKKYIPPLYKLTEGIRAISAILIGLSFAIRPLGTFIPDVIYWFTILIAPLLIIIPLLLTQTDNRQARYIIFAFVPLILCFILYQFIGVNSNFNNPFLQHLMQIAVLAQAIIMSIALSDGVIDIRKQRDFAHQINTPQSLSLEIEKSHSDLLNRVKMRTTFDPKLDHEKEVLRGFFKELQPVFNFHKAAIIYQIDKNMHIHANKDKFQIHFEDYIKENLIPITRICHGNSITKISTGDKVYFEKNTKIIVVPVFMRGQEWSGMLLNIDNSRHYTNSEKDALHRYATEMIRSMLNVHMVDSIREEVRQDPITQKLNRGVILDELEKAIQNSQFNESQITISMIDIDNFKDITDDQGKEFGNTCLTYLATKISKLLPEKTLIGRLGSNEFLAILIGHSAQNTEEFLSPLCEATHTLTVNDNEITLNLSIGITECRGSYETGKDIMKRADKGLQESKKYLRNELTIES